MAAGLHNIHSRAKTYLAICKVGLGGEGRRDRIYTTVCGVAARLFSALGSWALRHPMGAVRILCTVVALLALRLTYVAGVLHNDGPFAFICFVVAALALLTACGGAGSIEPDDDDTPAPQYRGTDFARDERARSLAALQGQKLLRRR